MSNIACSEYGIDSALYHKVCPRPAKASAAGFARIYISGLHRYVSKLEATLESKNTEIKLLKQRIEDKDAIIKLQTPNSIATPMITVPEPSAPKPSAPTKDV